MDTKALQDRITSCFKDGTLTVAPANLDTQAASRQLAAWFPKNLVLTDATLENTPAGVTATGTLTGWSGPDAVKATVDFGIDPADQSPSLYAQLVLPVTWTFGAAFPKIKGSAIDRLTYSASPLLLLTSTAREAADALPALQPGMTFHAAGTKPPADAGPLTTLLPLTDGTLALTGPLTPADKDGILGVDLRSAAHDTGSDLGISFFLWAGSRSMEESPLFYDVELRGTVRLSDALQIDVSTSLGETVVFLTAESPPTDPIPATALKSWGGLGEAFDTGETNGFKLGDHLRLYHLSVAIDTAQIGKGFAAAVTAVSVGIAADPGRSWDVAGAKLTVTALRALLTVRNPLRSGRTATLYAQGVFQIADSVNLAVAGLLPPGTLVLALDPDTHVTLADVLHHFMPGSDLSGAPQITLTTFGGQLTPTQGTYQVTAEADTHIPLELGAATITLTRAGLTLKRQKADSGTNTTANLHATAVVAPTGKPLTDGLTLTADWTIPGPFRLTGSFDKKVSLTDLLRQLAADTGLDLPSGMPDIVLSKTVASVQAGQGNWELMLSGAVSLNTVELDVYGKAFKTQAGTTALVAALWQGAGGTFSLTDVSQDAKDLPLLGDLTFTGSGLAVSTADGQNITVTPRPKGLPATVDKGLTFFSTLGFGKDLTFLTKLFPTAEGITVTAHLGSDLKKSEFTALIADAGALKGFTGLKLIVRPAVPEIAVQAGFTVTLPSLTGDGEPAQFNVEGSAGKSSTGWSFALTLLLRPAPGYKAGTVPRERLALALDAPGYTLLPAPPAAQHPWSVPPAAEVFLRNPAAPGHTPALVPWPQDADSASNLPLPVPLGYALLVPLPPAGPGHAPVYFDSKPAWKDAFGIKGLNINAFYLDIRLSSGELVLGGGGSITVGSGDGAVELALAVEGALEPPTVSVFYFDLAPHNKEKGVSLHAIASLLFTPPDFLDFLKKIVIHNLMLCMVTDPNGWTNNLTTPARHWDQGFYAAGDIGFFGNTWNFKVQINKTSLYINSEIDQPLKIGGFLTISDAGGSKGPKCLIDIRTNSIAEKVLVLSGKVTLLDVVSASVDVVLGKKGFEFTITEKIFGFSTTFSCTLDLKEGLTAHAEIRLQFDIGTPPDWHLPTTSVLGIDAKGTLDLDLTKDKTTVSASLKAAVTLAGSDLPAIDLSVKDLGITKFDDVLQYFKNTPSLIWDQLGNFAEDIGNCAVNTAEGKL
ncbi:hypothetical protein ACFVTF_23365 [Kitasatospora sp. NPDC057940]|uniref:hypothetical protein n=1 Tax=Kitasatospora sp. NPDC057940 TaxID=3346285 RepID=UPI0036DD327E